MGKEDRTIQNDSILAQIRSRPPERQLPLKAFQLFVMDRERPRRDLKFACEPSRSPRAGRKSDAPGGNSFGISIVFVMVNGPFSIGHARS